MPTEVGDHVIQLFLFGKAQESVVVTTLPGIDLDSTVVANLLPLIGENEVGTFQIIAKDKTGKVIRTKAKFDVTIKGKRHGVTPEFEIGDDGVTEVQWQPQKSGKYIIKIKLRGNDVADSPYVVHVRPGPVARISPVSVVQVMNVMVQVHPRTSHLVPCLADSVMVTVLDPFGQEKRFDLALNDDVYTVSFVGEPGEYTINALIDGQAARDCPFVLRIPHYEKSFEVTERFARFTLKG
eukprot:TRINITY_DN3989_c0_g2_i5.p1 TRINITY_DN3989_c0_g2~~TRINITY_DN3989_c0_g2_i5.p1  ORF type:complete len:238 (-),score=48.91 TRINITY_DN3989_c0_g2_i5:134-847(-)